MWVSAWVVIKINIIVCIVYTMYMCIHHRLGCVSYAVIVLARTALFLVRLHHVQAKNGHHEGLPVAALPIGDVGLVGPECIMHFR